VGLASDYWYSEIKDISAFNFGPEFPFIIGWYDKCFFLLFVGYYATCNGYLIKPRILFSYLDWENWEDTLFMTPNYVTITIAKSHTISMCVIDI
jgi:hypothetical protein